jgi:hypothetical protein
MGAALLVLRALASQELSSELAVAPVAVRWPVQVQAMLRVFALR